MLATVLQQEMDGSEGFKISFAGRKMVKLDRPDEEIGEWKE